jgi:predicted transcriptional regulator
MRGTLEDKVASHKEIEKLKKIILSKPHPGFALIGSPWNNSETEEILLKIILNKKLPTSLSQKRCNSPLSLYARNIQNLIEDGTIVTCNKNTKINEYHLTTFGYMKLIHFFSKK